MKWKKGIYFFQLFLLCRWRKINSTDDTDFIWEFVQYFNLVFALPALNSKLAEESRTYWNSTLKSELLRRFPPRKGVDISTISELNIENINNPDTGYYSSCLFS